MLPPNVLKALSKTCDTGTDYSVLEMNALLGASNVCIIAAILIVFGLVLYKGCHTLYDDRWLNLAQYGTAIY